MTQAKNGDTVNVHYTGKFDDGEVFDTSKERDPLKFTIGEGMVIPGFEKAVIGMSAGESKTIRIPNEEAYGSAREELKFAVEKTKFPENMEPQVGQFLEVHRDDGEIMAVMVAEISDQGVTLDANHPMAGKDLNFDIELVEILQ